MVSSRPQFFSYIVTNRSSDVMVILTVILSVEKYNHKENQMHHHCNIKSSKENKLYPKVTAKKSINFIHFFTGGFYSLLIFPHLSI